MRSLFVVVVVLGSACGAPSMMDAGVDAGADAGTRDAGTMMLPVDAGVMVRDAGPPPPQTATGSMTVNGVNYMITGGVATLSSTTLSIRLTTPAVDPSLQVSLVYPSDAGVGFSDLCSGPTTLLFSAQYKMGGQIAFYTRNQTCDLRLTRLAADAGQSYAGTFSGTADFDTRSLLNPGFTTITITNGTFTVERF